MSLVHGITHYGLVTSDGTIKLGQHRLRHWLVARRQQTITRIHVDFTLVKFCGIGMREISGVLKLLFEFENYNLKNYCHISEGALSIWQLNCLFNCLFKLTIKKIFGPYYWLFVRGNHLWLTVCFNSIFRLAVLKISLSVPRISGPLGGESTSDWLIPLTKGQ